MLITTLVVSFYEDGRGSVNVKLWFLVVCVRYEVLVVLCRLVIAGNVFLLIFVVVIFCVCGSRSVPLCMARFFFVCSRLVNRCIVSVN